MSDVVVTVPKNFTHPDAPGKKGLAAWIGEGDAAGVEDSYSFDEWSFYVGMGKPAIREGERVYVVCEDRLRGYAPLVRIEKNDNGIYVATYALVRAGGATAVAVTIPEHIVGFRGVRYRWWDRSIEIPFPDWMTP